MSKIGLKQIINRVQSITINNFKLEMTYMSCATSYTMLMCHKPHHMGCWHVIWYTDLSSVMSYKNLSYAMSYRMLMCHVPHLMGCWRVLSHVITVVDMFCAMSYANMQWWRVVPCHMGWWCVLCHIIWKAYVYHLYSSFLCRKPNPPLPLAPSSHN